MLMPMAPIIGSGANIYVLLAGAQGVNVSVTIDDGQPSVHVLAPIGPPSFTKAQQSLFNTQSLVSGDHKLTLYVLSWTNTFSGMMLDYIAVNKTFIAAPANTSSSVPAPASTTSAVPATSAAANSSSNSHSK